MRREVHDDDPTPRYPRRGWRHRPAPPPPRSGLARALERIGELAARLRRRLSGLGEPGWADYAARLARARTAVEVRAALVEAAAGLVPGSTAGFDPPGPYRPETGTLRIPARFAGRTVGVLRLRPRRLRRWPQALVRRLDGLAALAAAVEMALEAREAESSSGSGSGSGSGSEAEEVRPASVLTRDRATGLHAGPFLEAYLGQALPQARRRGESLSLVVIRLNNLEEVRRRDGLEFADAALGLAARAVVASLRPTDLVARLDADRLAVVMPGARKGDAHRLAALLRRAIREAGIASAAGGLDPSTGVAAYPEDADDLAGLRRAAEAIRFETSRLAPARP